VNHLYACVSSCNVGVHRCPRTLKGMPIPERFLTTAVLACSNGLSLSVLMLHQLGCFWHSPPRLLRVLVVCRRRLLSLWQ
jgi:hypothetical protein